jgi:hypothetical protein
MHSQQSNSLPSIECGNVPAAPALEALPVNAAGLEEYSFVSFHRLRQETAGPLVTPTFATKVWCFRDETVLNVVFQCECPDVWATKTQRDTDLWNEPVVEVFLDVLGDGKSFFEFQVNPLGTVYDAFVPDVKLNADWKRWSRWNCDSLKTAVRVDGCLNDRQHRDTGWSAALAIPFDELAKEAGTVPQAGDVWRANFCRYDYSAELPSPELSCWAPVVKCFDDTKYFGLIVFSE